MTPLASRQGLYDIDRVHVYLGVTKKNFKNREYVKDQ